MKRITTILSFLLILSAASAQILDPAKWTYTVEQGKAGEATLVFKVKLDPEWHVYSQFTPDGGPLPMEFQFDVNPCYELSGKVSEPKPHEDFDSTFGVKVLYFNKEVTFRQNIKVKKDACKVTGKVGYQVCKESCIFLEKNFTFTIGKTKSEIIPASKDTMASVVPVTVKDTVSASVVTPVSDSTKNTGSTTGSTTMLEEGCGNDQGGAGSEDKSMIGILLAGMLGGLLALLTPCVFPMVPMTVSFFTKRSGSRAKGIRNAIIYALSIILIYVTLGLLVTISFGSDALNDLASNVYFNMAFFIIFIIFAISFFGAFEITLPSWMINKADAVSDRGGLIGIFFMAFTLSLVSFSCTGPIIGTLLVEAAHGRSYIGPLAGMTGFSFALAVPFALFSLFPGWLNSLPKSGGWLNTVKVTLGFIELALALKFFSNVDLAYHWGFLKRELFVSLWIIIFTMLGFYLLGKIRFAHDTEVTHISISRMLFAMVALTFSLYLVPGVWGAPLKLISGFPPPDFYKEWKTGKESECPHDLNCFHDFEEGMYYARQQGKPVIVDFTGWSCVNCRKMEDNVWSDPKVMKRLAEQYVLISLYVDDKTALPPDMQIVSPATGRAIRTTGNKWSDLQASVYNTNSQPYYVLLDNKGKILANPRGYTPDIKTYSDFLDEGLCRYKKRKASV